MQVTNPLVPPAVGQAGGASAPVANAPAAETAKPQSAQPVTSGRESQNGGNETRREPDRSADESRGRQVDFEA
jgi:hypothetical protein